MEKNLLKYVLFFVSLSFLSATSVIAQTESYPKPPTEQDYNRARTFVWDSISKNVYHLNLSPDWLGDQSGFTYQTNTPDGKEFYSVDFSSFDKKKSFDREKFAEALADLTGKKINAKQLPIRMMHWANFDNFSFYYQADSYQIDLKDYSIRPMSGDYKPKDKKVSVSPDKKFEVFIKDYNLWIRNLESQEEEALTTEGSETYMMGSAYGWSQTWRGENNHPEPRLHAVWSPDSKKILTQISDTRIAEKMYMLDWSIDSLYRPELVSYFRPSPGDSTFVKMMPVVIDIESKKMTKIDLEPQPHMLDLGDNLYWKKDSKALYGTYDHRGFQQKDIIEVNIQTGKVEVLYSDKSETNIDYRARFRFYQNEGLAFFTSEKTGWKQLYKLDWKSRKVTPITQGEFMVNDIERVDFDQKRIYFTASGREKGVNPYYQMLYSVGLNGKNLKLITPEAYNHQVSVAPNFKYFVDNISAPNNPTRSVLRELDSGKIVKELETAEVSYLENKGWKYPETFSTQAKDGKTDIYGIIYKPTNFKPNLKYPVVEYSYTGPHMNVLPNTFSGGIYGLYNSAQALAELGFVVVQIDGRGSAGRSKAFHDVSYRNLGNNLQDHAHAIQYLGEEYDWFDADRVGIFGHSFGGYDAMHALLEFNEVYKVAISESADHDWRMEKAWYPELYAGWPVAEHYHDQSNITMAHLMKGKLLLIHGGLDENVNPSATFKLTEALIKADKYFDLLIVPSARHAFPKKYYPYLQKKRWDFFVEHLIKNPQ